MIYSVSPSDIFLFLRLISSFHQTCQALFARIWKMPVWNSNHKISACPKFATQLLQILITTTFNSSLRQKTFVTKVIIESFSKKLLPVQKEGFQDTTCPKNRLGGSWISPCPQCNNRENEMEIEKNAYLVYWGSQGLSGPSDKNTQKYHAKK